MNGKGLDSPSAIQPLDNNETYDKITPLTDVYGSDSNHCKPQPNAF